MLFVMRCMVVGSLLMLLLSQKAAPQAIVRRLPGFPGDLPFTLETGYVGLSSLGGVEADIQLFYYFIESERSPKDDPLLLWLTGGPGCSAFTGLAYENGPLRFDYSNSTGNRPQLVINPYSWTQVASIIYLDAPVGTGFSYAMTQEAYYSNDTKSAETIYQFIKKWLQRHPQFYSNAFFVAGDSYTGYIVPMVAQLIVIGNKYSSLPPINLQGYMLGNPLTDFVKDENSRVEFAYFMALITKELYESAKNNCKGHYFDVDQTISPTCAKDLETFRECTAHINPAHILEPNCNYLSPEPPPSNPVRSTSSSVEFTSVIRQPAKLWCRFQNYIYAFIWLNDQSVRNALHVRQGTVSDWVRCNASIQHFETYTRNINSSLDFHRYLVGKVHNVLIYSGDHDMLVPYTSTMAWIKSLNLTLEYDWEPWFVDGQVGGYTMQYSYLHAYYYLTYATVKGGGHTAPEYRPKECFAMIERWLALYNL